VVVCCSLDSQFRSINTLYTKPYTRVGGYLAGVWTGYYLSKINRQWSVRKVSFVMLRHSTACSLLSLFIFAGNGQCDADRFIADRCVHGVHSTVSHCGQCLGLISFSGIWSNALGDADLFHDCCRVDEVQWW
jgi:hypothetical protein